MMILEMTLNLNKNTITINTFNIMSNTLMNKTKRELVDIILRKDDIHKKINDTNKDLNNKIKNLNKLISDKDIDLANKNNDIANLNKQINEFKDCCDEYASKYFELIDKCDRFKNIAILSTCITIAVLISILTLL